MELYDLAAAPSEAKDLAATKSDVLAKLAELAAKAHEPSRKALSPHGTATSANRRAKFGKQDESKARSQKKAKGKAKE